MNNVRIENNTPFFRGLVACIAVSAVLTTLASLFFTNIIPLNSHIASLASGYTCTALNIFPLIISLYCAYRLKKTNFSKISSKPTFEKPSTDSEIKNTQTAQLTDEFSSQFRQAVLQKDVKTVKNILNTITTKESLETLLLEKTNIRSVFIIAAFDDNLEIVQLIIEKAKNFNLLNDILFFIEDGEKWCACTSNNPNVTKYIMQSLHSHPDILKEVLEWTQPHSGRSLFQLIIAEETKIGKNETTTAILDAADTLDMCLSIVTFVDAEGRSCFETEYFSGHGFLVIQSIMRAVGTIENQLKVIALAKDEEGSIKCGNLSCLAIRKYELFCAAETEDIQTIEALLKRYGKRFKADGTIAEAYAIASANDKLVAKQKLSNALN